MREVFGRNDDVPIRVQCTSFTPPSRKTPAGRPPNKAMELTRARGGVGGVVSDGRAAWCAPRPGPAAEAAAGFAPAAHRQPFARPEARSRCDAIDQRPTQIMW